MSEKRIIVVATICLIVLTVPATAIEPGPQGVSPGAPDRFTLVTGACPTFSWEETSGSAHYELVVHRYDDAARASSNGELSPETEVLFTSVSGRATSWTPEVSDCFKPGVAYVWFVRAVTDTEVDDGGEWSEPRFFEIDAAPSADELERAVEVMRRWEAATGDESPRLSAAAASGTGSGSGSSQLKGASQSRSPITGTAAIRGEQPDPSGESYGVVGISASPDGAGIGAANTSGGPDLVLDGVVPAELSEAGIDRPSASAQTFSISNTGGGGLTLDVDGVEVVTTATDSDILADLSCSSDEMAKWNGSTWICAPDDDTDTDTVGDLNCGSGQVAKWNGSTWACADDDDTDTDTLGDLSCPSGQIAKRSGSTWICSSDNDTDTLGDLSCPSGQIARRSGSTWICSSDNDTDTLDDLSCSSGQVAKWNGSTWACATDDDDDTLANLSCPSGQIAKRSGSTWICAVDVDTDTNTNASTMCPNGYFLNGDGSCDYADGSGSCSSGRVCLGGHTHPADEITDGEMNIGSNLYSHSAKYGYYHVPGGAFTVYSEFAGGYYQIHAYMKPDGSEVSGAAPLNIPDGANIIRVTGYYYDNGTTSPNPTYRCAIFRRPATLAGGYLVAEQETTTDWANSTILHEVHGSAVSHTVDKSTHAYYLVASLDNSDGTHSFRHYGCRVTYTYANTNN